MTIMRNSLEDHKTNHLTSSAGCYWCFLKTVKYCSICDTELPSDPDAGACTFCGTEFEKEEDA